MSDVGSFPGFSDSIAFEQTSQDLHDMLFERMFFCLRLYSGRLPSASCLSKEAELDLGRADLVASVAK